MRVSISSPTALVVLMISVKYQSDCAALKKKDLPSMVDQGIARPIISPDYPRRPYQISPIDCLFGKRSVYCSDPLMPCHGNYCVPKPDPCIYGSHGCLSQPDPCTTGTIDCSPHSHMCSGSDNCLTQPIPCRAGSPGCPSQPNPCSSSDGCLFQPDPCVLTDDCRLIYPTNVFAVQQSPFQTDPCISKYDCRQLNPTDVSVAKQSSVPLDWQQQMMTKN